MLISTQNCTSLDANMDAVIGMAGHIKLLHEARALQLQMTSLEADGNMDEEVWEQLYIALVEQGRPAWRTALQHGDTNVAWNHCAVAAEAALQALADHSPEGTSFSEGRAK